MRDPAVPEVLPDIPAQRGMTPGVWEESTGRNAGRRVKALQPPPAVLRSTAPYGG